MIILGVVGWLSYVAGFLTGVAFGRGLRAK
jgi:hypothetical protein